LAGGGGRIATAIIRMPQEQMVSTNSQSATMEALPKRTVEIRVQMSPRELEKLMGRSQGSVTTAEWSGKPREHYEYYAQDNKSGIGGGAFGK
jgi:hypothetical protein